MLIGTIKDGTISLGSTPREFEAWCIGIKWSMIFQ
jgi:hypothetical protein